MQLTEAFVDALVADFQQHGRDAIRQCREESPQQLLRILASITPKQVEISGGDDDAVSLILAGLKARTSA